MTAFDLLREAIRRVLRNPGVSLVVAATFASVIALNTAIFSVVKTVILDPLPYAEPNRVVIVGRTGTSNSARPAPVSWPEYLDWSERSSDFDGLAAAGFRMLSLSTPTGTRIAEAAVISPNLFNVLGSTTALGRVLSPTDVTIQGSQPIVLGHAFWVEAFAADAGIIGRRIQVSGFASTSSFEIAGVMSRDFQIRFPEAHDVYVIESGTSINRGGLARRAAAVTVFGKLRPWTSREQAATAMRTLDSILKREYPTSVQAGTVNVVSAHEFFFGGTKQVLIPLLGAAVLILLLACVNVASIFLLMTIDRSTEFSTRLALGASRGRVAALLVTEHALLGTLGGLGGILVAASTIGILRHFAPPELPRAQSLFLDWKIVGASGAVSVVAGLLSGLLPAFRFLRVGASRGFRSVNRSVTPELRMVPRILMTAQVGLVLVLVVAAGLMLGSVHQLLGVDLGFQPERLAGIRLRFTQQHFGEDGIALQDRLKLKMLTMPGIVAAGWTSEIPLGQRDSVIVGLRHVDKVSVRYRIVSTGYLETIGATLLQGRLFETQDRAGPPVAIVNRSFAERYLNPYGGSSVGSEVLISELHRVVGVIADVREASIRSPDEPTVYWLFSAKNWMAGGPWLVARFQDPRGGVEKVRETVVSVAPNLAIVKTTMMTDRVRDEMAGSSFLTLVLTGIAAVGLAIAAVGVYSGMSYAVRRRSREIGLRIALGASGRVVSWTILREVTAILTVGILAGLGASWYFSRSIRTLLYGLDSNDPSVAATAVCVLALTVLGAAIRPLRRAVATDPAIMLREN